MDKKKFIVIKKGEDKEKGKKEEMVGKEEGKKEVKKEIKSIARQMQSPDYWYELSPEYYPGKILEKWVKKKAEVEVGLRNGNKWVGKIIGIGQYEIVMKIGRTTVVIYKHTIDYIRLINRV